MSKNHRLTYVSWAFVIFIALIVLVVIVAFVYNSIVASIAADAQRIRGEVARVVENPDYPDRIRKDFEDAVSLWSDGQYSQAKKAYESILQECSQLENEMRRQAEADLEKVKEKSELLYEQSDLVQAYERAEKLMGERRYKSASAIYSQILLQFAEITKKKEQQRADAEREKKERERQAEELMDEASRLHLTAKKKADDPKFRNEVAALFKVGEDDLKAEKYASAKTTFEKVISRCDEIEAAEKRREQLQAEAESARASAKKLFDTPVYRDRVSVDFEMGETLLGEGKLELAKQSFDKAVEGARLYDKEVEDAAAVKRKKKFDTEQILKKAQKLLANEAYEKTTMAADFASGKKLFEQEEYDLAAQTFHRVIATAEETDAEKLEAERKYLAAKPLSENALYSRLVQAEFQAGEGFLRSRDYPQAAERFAKVKEIAGNIDREKKDAETAYANAKKLAEGPYADKVAAEFAAGKKFLEEGNYKLAAESFVKVEKIVDEMKKLAVEVGNLRAKITQTMRMRIRRNDLGVITRVDHLDRSGGLLLIGGPGAPNGPVVSGIRITNVMSNEFLNGEKYADNGDLHNAKRCFENVLNMFEAELKKLR